MTDKEREYALKVGAISTILFVVGIIIAIKMKKGFWVGVGFSMLGSMLGYGIGYLVIPFPKDAPITPAVPVANNGYNEGSITRIFDYQKPV
jgi:hypothetical protein